MKIFIIGFLVVLSTTFSNFNKRHVFQPKDEEQKTITADVLKQHIEFLASDSLKGRNTPSPELDSAASYIAKKFKSYGLQSVQGSYFQKTKLGYIHLAKNNQLKIKTGNTETSYLIKKDFTPFEMTGSKSIEAQVVFAGYGIDAPEYNYNDYSNINVKGKIVFILKHEPGEDDAASIFKGRQFTKYSNIAFKIKKAIEHGAAGVLIAQDPLNHILLSPRGYPWPSLSSFIPNDAVPLSLLIDEQDKIPVVQVGENVINQLFGSVEELKTIQTGIDKKLRPNSFEIKNSEVALTTQTNISESDANNVIGFIEGTDPQLKNEILIIGAHYDHIGYKKSHKEGEDYIYNGADDNASGTAGVLAIAEALGKAKVKPKRSILFINFCGEEKGLYGSRYYTKYPLFPEEKTVAMLNMDMIGRNGIDSVSVFGCVKNPKLAQIVKQANKEISFHLDLEDGIHNGDSDHSSFQKIGIPSICFHSGIHKDLHKVSDESSKINFEKAAKISKLVFITANIIANENNHYK